MRCCKVSVSVCPQVDVILAGLYALTLVCQLLTNKFKAGAATS